MASPAFAPSPQQLITPYKAWLWAELVLLFVGFPLNLWMRWWRVPWAGVLFAAGILIVLWLRFRKSWRWRDFWFGDPAAERAELRPLLLRFALSALVLLVAVAVIAPDKLFNLPLNNTQRWLALMFGYPIFSVFVQELVFRGFFFERYKPILTQGLAMVAVNAALFGWAHVFFSNPLISVGLCVLGGVMFARTYARTRSLRMACLEHALYGNLVFTIGLGEYFFGGGGRRIG